ncbi:hypoxia up-regulated protein 1-like [Strongylocentrotus purpuratus]|uniref:Hypoxia up-regulated protein 1 n=1 Tax=Strongylocentrotus purpuratus TaxID=7668 RepID=A0A7M7SVP7_STRPU|nr:hypoxia up-regulated protein 1-like [Strongylocentrotus purpuratus]
MQSSSIVGLLSAVTLAVLAGHPQLTNGLAVMSIDLGSEWIKVAVVKPGIPMEIVLNKESRRKTPVSITVRDDETLYGDPALSLGVRYPKSNYYYLQDLLAKPLENPLVKLHQNRFPFYELGQDEDRGTIFFKHNDDVIFHPEELLAIALNKSRESAETFAEQMVRDAVITVPAFFNQAERRAVLYAAELAGLRVLQLMNANTAVALNYGAFRRKDFNATPHNIMFYDMGAGSTTATIVSYQLVKTKERGKEETNPQLAIKGVGFDRTLGGLEWEIRLQKHLAVMFNQQGKTTNKVETSNRSMAKLLKEAKRVKKVLSANNDITSQIEGLLDDKDFKGHVSRAELEKMTSDLFERVGGPVERALKSSEMTMDEIDQIILVGGGTRIPKVQETLLKVTGKKELGKSINADEAAALGAVYHAAHLSKGFKVKKFLIKDANVFPIQVEFERDLVDDDGREITRSVTRTLFGIANPYPQKKVMTFNRHYDDFAIKVNYGNLERVMSEDDLDAFGVRKLLEVNLKGVKEAIEKNPGSDNKGIKAHFRIDESGIFHLDTVESVFETTKNVTETTEEEQSTLAKLGSTISRFFSGGSNTDEDDDTQTETEENGEEEGEGEAEAEQEEKTDDTPPEGEKEEDGTAPEQQEENGEQPAGEETTDKAPQDQEAADAEGKEGKEEKEEETEKETEEEGEKSDAETEKKTEEGEKESSEDEGEKKSSEDEGEKKEEESKDEAPKEEEKTETKPKIVTKKENITVEIQVLDLNEPTKASKKASRNKLKQLRKKEEERYEREQALNNLESFIFGAQDKLYDEDYEKCSTEESREEMRATLSEASDWLYDQEPDVPVQAYKDKLKALKKMLKSLEYRVEQLRLRPTAIKAAKSALNVSYHFMLAAKNVTGEDLLYTETEFGLLEKAYNDTNLFFTTKMEEQKRTALTEKPAWVVSELEEKLISLEREVRYLVGKAKSTPKPKKKKKVDKKKKTTNSTATDEGNAEGEKDGEKEEKEKVVIPPPEEGEGATENAQEEAPDTAEVEGGEEQAQEEPTEPTPTGEEEQTPEEPTEPTPTGEEEETPEEPLQLEAPVEEATESTQEEAAPTEETTTTEGAKSQAEHSHKNGDL